MNITLNTTQLAQELRLLNHVAPQKPALPILAYVLFHAADTLTLSATDLEIGLRTTCKATITEPGIITLPAQRLLNLIEQLPDTDVIIQTDGLYVHVLSGAFRSRLQTMSPDDFPKLPDAEGETSTMSALQPMISKIRYAVTDKSKYVANGALLTLTDTVMALVATDGKRLSIVTSPRGAGALGSIVVPTKTLDAVLLLDGALTFSHTDRHLFFRAGERLLISRTVEGQFPAYDRIIPRDTDKHAVVNRTALAAALRRIGVLSEDNQAAYFDFSVDGLVVTSSSAEAGDALEQVPVVYKGEPLKVRCNWRYVLDFLEAGVGESIVLDLKEATTPMLCSDGDAFINVVMLMRG